MRLRLFVLLMIGFWCVHAQAASPYIDCAKARTVDERAICASPRLVQMDAEMSTLYRVALGFVGMGMRGAIRDDQEHWLVERRRCGASYSCLRAQYRLRISELDRVLEQIRLSRPF